MPKVWSSPRNSEKRRTIPNLELQAALICAKSAMFVRKELEKEIKINSTKLWTDSMDIVDFLRSTKLRDKFIKNRVQIIREFFVGHIAGTSNPADLASRGVAPEVLRKSEIWFTGPD